MYRSSQAMTAYPTAKAIAVASSVGPHDTFS